MENKRFKPTDPHVKSAFYCGIDVHKREITAAIYGRDDSQAEFLKTNVFLATKEGLDAFWQFASFYHPHGFAMEATGIYHHTVSLFLEQKRSVLGEEFEIVIVNPADAKGIPGKQKCDRLDARDLARYYSAGLLKTGKPIIVVFEDLKALFRMEYRLEKERTAMKNRIKKTLDRAGFRPDVLDLNVEWANAMLLALTHHTGSIREFVHSSLLPDSPFLKYKAKIMKALRIWEPYLDVVLSGAQKALIRQDLFDLDLKTSRQTLLKVEIEKALTDRIVLRDLAYRLATIPGISVHSAVWMLAEIGGIRRFHNAKEFLSYCGCIPRANSSAGKVYSAHISRHSNKYLRTILYQAARVDCVLLKRDSSLKQYADRALARKPHSPTVAYCIVGAKIARIAYAIIRQGTQFSPELGQNKHLVCDSVPKKHMSIVEQKDLQRAKRALQRIQGFKRVNVVTSELSTLINALEVILAKN